MGWIHHPTLYSLIKFLTYITGTTYAFNIQNIPLTQKLNDGMAKEMMPIKQRNNNFHLNYSQCIHDKRKDYRLSWYHIKCIKIWAKAYLMWVSNLLCIYNTLVFRYTEYHLLKIVRVIYNIFSAFRKQMK